MSDPADVSAAASTSAASDPDTDGLTAEQYAAILAFPQPIQVANLTPVHMAAALGKLDDLKKLLDEQGAEYPVPTALLPSPLCIAAMNPPYYRVITYLANSGRVSPGDELPLPWLEDIPIRTALALKTCYDSQDEYDTALISAVLNIKCVQMLAVYAQGGMDDEELRFHLTAVRHETQADVDAAGSAITAGVDKTIPAVESKNDSDAVPVAAEGNDDGDKNSE